MAQGIGEGKTEAAKVVETKEAPQTEVEESSASSGKTRQMLKMESSSEQEFIQSLSVEQRQRFLALLLQEGTVFPKAILPSSSAVPAPAKTVATLSSVPISLVAAPAKMESLSSVGTASSPLSSSMSSSSSSSTPTMVVAKAESTQALKGGRIDLRLPEEGKYEEILQSWKREHKAGDILIIKHGENWEVHVLRRDEKQGEAVSRMPVSSSDFPVSPLITHTLPDVGEQLEIDVTTDGTCLFYSIALGVLLPVVKDTAAFAIRFEQLFGRTSLAGAAEELQRLLSTYDGEAEFITRYAAVLEVLVDVSFRTYLVTHMQRNRAKFAGVTYTDAKEDFDADMKKMMTPKEWGGHREVEAASQFLKRRIIVYEKENTGRLVERAVYGEVYTGKPLYLVRTTATTLGRVNNHYHYLLAPVHLPVTPTPRRLEREDKVVEVKCTTVVGISLDSDLGKELARVTRENIASFDKTNIQDLLSKPILFESYALDLSLLSSTPIPKMSFSFSSALREDDLLELESVDDSGYPPKEQLRRAACRGDVGKIDALLKVGTKPGDSLFAAAEAKNSRAFEQLLAASPDLRQKQDGYSIAEYVALSSPWSTSEKRAALEILTKQGQALPSIHWAACLGEEEEVAREIRRGQLAVIDEVGNTAALYASANGHLSLLKELYRKGARVMEANKNGDTALLFAAWKGHLAVVQWLLIGGGARVTEADKDGTTALLLAARKDHLPVVQWLLVDYGAPCDRKFLEFIKKSKYDWLRCYGAFADSLKQSVSSQVEALKAVLDYTGKERGCLIYWIMPLLLNQNGEALLKDPELRRSTSFTFLWDEIWHRYTHREMEGFALFLSKVYWTLGKWELCHLYLNMQPIKVLHIITSQWSTESWQIFLQNIIALPLVRLDLTDNHLNDEKLLQLAGALKSNRSLTQLILNQNQLSYRGFQAFLKILEGHPTLRHIFVQENLIRETDKGELDRTIGAVLRDEKCRLQTVDVSRNYLMSRATHPTRLAAIRQLLRSTGLTAEEFAQAEWLREKDSPKGRHLTILSLQINGSARDFEIPIEVMETLAAYGREEKLDTDLRKWRDLQTGLTDTLRRYPELRPVRLRDLPAENIKEQKRVCKQLLFFHPQAPLKAYLKSHRKLRSSTLPTARALLLPGAILTSQVWKIYFVVKKASALEEHAMLVWEGLYSYGQRMIKAAHLQAVKRGDGMFARKQIVIDYFPFDIQRSESFGRNYDIVAFTIWKKRIKAMELLIEREIGELPGKYKMVLSSGSVSSLDEDQKVMTNCQKWALEKLEVCLEMKEGTLQTQMSARPSVTATNLHRLLTAKRRGSVDEKEESKIVTPTEGGSKCCVM